MQISYSFSYKRLFAFLSNSGVPKKPATGEHKFKMKIILVKFALTLVQTNITIKEINALSNGAI